MGGWDGGHAIKIQDIQVMTPDSKTATEWILMRGVILFRGDEVPESHSCPTGCCRLSFAAKNGTPCWKPSFPIEPVGRMVIGPNQLLSKPTAVGSWSSCYNPILDI